VLDERRQLLAEGQGVLDGRGESVGAVQLPHTPACNGQHQPTVYPDELDAVPCAAPTKSAG
jgi:hypothetical protein